MEHKFEVIDCLRVVLVILIIFLHAYTATMFVEWLHKGYPMYAFITYNFALLGGYIAVPFFFFPWEGQLLQKVEAKNPYSFNSLYNMERYYTNYAIFFAK